MITKRIHIGVIGHSDDSLINKEALISAEKVGKEIAKSNSILVCGGMGGIMEAAARGAKKKEAIL